MGVKTELFTPYSYLTGSEFYVETTFCFCCNSVYAGDSYICTRNKYLPFAYDIACFDGAYILLR